ncbi:hypothetical protein PsorP6_001421 [Peronosclerospora sorghi]|uniref:Uncharacterized protein n=1 Tax=Peronosclerospora sorghi TaxID=230839 RepID=A0ACC0WWH5_9STRA|nr:hypothetical protein PsorP6_001421 [Peronosclerospora sorghi]
MGDKRTPPHVVSSSLFFNPESSSSNILGQLYAIQGCHKFSHRHYFQTHKLRELSRNLNFGSWTKSGYLHLNIFIHFNHLHPSLQ